MTKKPAADPVAAAAPVEAPADTPAPAEAATEAAAASEPVAPVEKPAADPVAAEPEVVDGQLGDGGDLALAATEAEVLPEAPSLANPDSLGDAVIMHPHGATSCNFDGVTYDADEAGRITVPLRAVSALATHGFVLAD